MNTAEKIACAVARPMRALSVAASPFVWLLSRSTAAITRLLGLKESDNKVTEEEIRMMLAEGREQGTIRPEESQMIQNVFEFDDTPAEQAGTHRKDVVFLHMEDEDAVWDQTILESRFTYFPVCRENRDNVIGILDTRDYFRLKDRSRESLMEHAVDRPFLVPETMRAHSLLSAMKKERKYFAVLLDEYGSVTGIVTLHDLVEELVGDLGSDDSNIPDDDEPRIEKLPDGSLSVTGNVELDDLEDALDIELDQEEHDTLTGLVFDALGMIPDDGEQDITLEAEGMRIHVTSIADHQVNAAQVWLLPKEAPPEDEE